MSTKESERGHLIGNGEPANEGKKRFNSLDELLRYIEGEARRRIDGRSA